MGGGGDALQIESVSNTYGWRSVETARGRSVVEEHRCSVVRDLLKKNTRTRFIERVDSEGFAAPFLSMLAL